MRTLLLANVYNSRGNNLRAKYCIKKGKVKPRKKTYFNLEQIKSSLEDVRMYYSLEKYDLAAKELRILVSHFSPAKDEKCASDPEIAEAHYLLGMSLKKQKAFAIANYPFLLKYSWG